MGDNQRWGLRPISCL